MEGKLYKSPNGEHYYLTVDGKIFAEIGGHPLKTINQSLSLKNCQAIENGYDLDELAREACNITDPLRLDSQKYKQDPYFRIGFIKGFQKALEIIGDKKFSESYVIRAYIEGTNDGAQFESMMDYDHSDNSEAQDFSEQAEQDFRKSLQQTEWDVEVVMDICGDKVYAVPEPVLDADGCLILRRI